MNEHVVIVGAARTAIGAFQGAYSKVSATELGAVAVKAALAQTGIDVSNTSEVFMGCVLPAGLGQAPARQAAIKAGVANHVPATTVNKMCGSGMQTVAMASAMLTSDYSPARHGMVIAGGLESMTNAPYLLPKARGGFRLGHGEVKDHMFLDGLEDAYNPGQLMGVFAEQTASKYGFSREQQDAFALRSLERAQAAIAAGAFQSEIAPVMLTHRGKTTEVDTDEIPGTLNAEKIPTLRPAFAKDGTVTAANASSIADGAAALALMTEAAATEQGAQPLARIKAIAVHAHEPEWFTTAPVGAVQKVLQQANWQVDEVDLYEINEAFAVVTMAAIQDLELDHEKVNVHGGACALGHPIGATGARILVTLISSLQARGLQKGVAALCIGGGEALAVALEII